MIESVHLLNEYLSPCVLKIIDDLLEGISFKLFPVNAKSELEFEIY